MQYLVNSFLRNLGDGKVVMVTILPEEMVKETDQGFYSTIVKTDITTNMRPSVVIGQKMTKEEFEKTTEIDYDTEITGNGIGGILMLPVWIMHKLKDQLGGLWG